MSWARQTPSAHTGTCFSPSRLGKHRQNAILAVSVQHNDENTSLSRALFRYIHYFSKLSLRSHSRDILDAFLSHPLVSIAFLCKILGQPSGKIAVFHGTVTRYVNHKNVTSQFLIHAFRIQTNHPKSCFCPPWWCETCETPCVSRFS